MIGSLCLRLLVFFFVFALDVRVKAETSEHETLLQQPEGCAHQPSDTSCAVQTDSENTFVFDLGKGKVILDRETTVVRLNDHQVRLVSGTIWVRPAAHQALSVKTEFGEARADGDYWVARTSDRMVISASSKNVEMFPKGSTETLTIPSGLENSLGKVAKDGRASTGLPMPIQPASHLSRWARLYQGKKADFEKEVAAFKSLWIEAKGEATEFQQALYQRKIANLENAAAEKAKSREKVEARNRELREHFRRRVLDLE